MLPLVRPHSFRLRGTAACLLAVFALGACSGVPGPAAGVIQVAFADDVRVVDAAGGGDPPGSAQAGREIVDLITNWYQGAFVDPAGFGDPSFPDVVRLFTGEAGSRVRGEIESVTIGKIGAEVRSVVPEVADVDVTLYYDDAETPAYAVADVTFQALASLKSTQAPLTISQTGTYFLRRVQSAWRIFSYQARNDQVDRREPGP